ncbi:unnamed protein product [Closterium sp. Naga37s-1]|nr:unnamed protein product [Closterium sp. Naga37s-1]
MPTHLPHADVASPATHALHSSPSALMPPPGAPAASPLPSTPSPSQPGSYPMSRVAPPYALAANAPGGLAGGAMGGMMSPTASAQLRSSALANNPNASSQGAPSPSAMPPNMGKAGASPSSSASLPALPSSLHLPGNMRGPQSAPTMSSHFSPSSAAPQYPSQAQSASPGGASYSPSAPHLQQQGYSASPGGGARGGMQQVGGSGGQGGTEQAEQHGGGWWGQAAWDMEPGDRQAHRCGVVDACMQLEPEVEEVLLDLADDFIQSVTAFGCQLARHRKAQVLEAKDVLLHLERSWHMRIPGFTGDDYRVYKRPVSSLPAPSHCSCFALSVLLLCVARMVPFRLLSGRDVYGLGSDGAWYGVLVIWHQDLTCSQSSSAPFLAAVLAGPCPPSRSVQPVTEAHRQRLAAVSAFSLCCSSAASLAAYPSVTIPICHHMSFRRIIVRRSAAIAANEAHASPSAAAAPGSNAPHGHTAAAAAAHAAQAGGLEQGAHASMAKLASPNFKGPGGASGPLRLQPSNAQSLAWRESWHAPLPLALSPMRQTRRGRWAVGAAKGGEAEGAGAEGAGAEGAESSTALTAVEAQPLERRPDNLEALTLAHGEGAITLPLFALSPLFKFHAPHVLFPPRVCSVRPMTGVAGVSPALLQEMGEEERTPIQKWLNPGQDELPDDVPMSIWDHLEELRERVLVSVGAVGAAILLCFFFSRDLVVFLEAPVYAQGVRFLQLSPGEYFFTTLKVAGYCGLLLGGPVILYEVIAFVVPGLTASERRFLAPIVFGSSVLFYSGIAFSYSVLTPAALNFFISYAEGVVESLWSIDQYFEFVLLLMFSTGLSFQASSSPSRQAPLLPGKLLSFQASSSPSRQAPLLPGKLLSFQASSSPSRQAPLLPGKLLSFQASSSPSRQAPLFPCKLLSFQASSSLPMQASLLPGKLLSSHASFSPSRQVSHLRGKFFLPRKFPSFQASTSPRPTPLIPHACILTTMHLHISTIAHPHSHTVPVIQLLLGQLGLVTADQMLGIWRYVVVGGVTAAAVLTPSTDPLTQCLLAGPLIGLYMGGAYLVKLLQGSKSPA